MYFRAFVAVAVAGLFLPSLILADDPTDIRELKLRDWMPRSMLVTKTTNVDKPMFPVIDDHNHLGTGKAFLTPQRVKHYLEEMDAAGVRTVVNLDGMWDDALRETLAALDEAHPGRFLTFAQINFDGLDDADWSRREADRLEQSFKMGAKGLKFHKSLGLDYRFRDGKYLLPDDAKMGPIYEMCAKYHRPIMIHTADPAAFFTALDKNNERWHELNQHPGWLFYGKDFPKRQVLLDAFIHAVAKHPRTTFIGAHFGNNAEDPATVAQWLDKYPNLVIDIDARISELGRQPYTARKFLIKYQDRVMFGTDTPCNRQSYRTYYRFLETDDEYFDSTPSHHLQGFWMIYGVFLPKDVLEKIYCKNAERLLFFGDERGVSHPTTGDTRSFAKPATRAGEIRANSTSAATTAADATHKTIAPQKPRGQSIHVQRTEDFEVTGDGGNAAWRKTDWIVLQKLSGGLLDYDARFKMLYSPKGVYVLMTGSDREVTASIKEDFADLWHEDAFEFFLWPDQRESIYFEYEISPLDRELAILVPNLDGKQLGWRPWHYEGARKIRKAVSVSGGTAKSGAEITGWTAEVFVPYELLRPLRNVPPQPGARWRANFYRVDYDNQRATAWSWTPVGPSFHEYEKFGTLLFE
jgi:predicted TIM-barrel fold metal-dependent hydrolase